MSSCAALWLCRFLESGVKDPPLHPHVTLGKWVVLSALPAKEGSARSSVVLELPCAQEPPGMRV